MDELKGRVSNLRSHLEPTDVAADAALGELSDKLIFASDEKPYESPEFWGSFIFSGLA